MFITKIEYRELYTDNFNNFNNFTVGAVAEIANNENPDEALEELKSWVRNYGVKNKMQKVKTGT